ncbi:MAG: hypothetical protein SWE60_20705 [Thermodesulfobacteriota bacterium]|nr:hypothetical protein [Thermodesulfobacteriota bacterium]
MRKGHINHHTKVILIKKTVYEGLLEPLGRHYPTANADHIAFPRY